MFIQKSLIAKWAHVFKSFFLGRDIASEFNSHYRGLGLTHKNNTVEKDNVSNNGDFTMHDIFKNENILSSVLWDTMDIFFNQNSKYFYPFDSLKRIIESKKTKIGTVPTDMVAVTVNIEINKSLNPTDAKGTHDTKDFPLLEDVVCLFASVLGYDFDVDENAGHNVKILSGSENAKAEWKTIILQAENLIKIQNILNRFKNLEFIIEEKDFNQFFNKIKQAEDKRGELSTKECHSLYLGFAYLKECIYKECTVCKINAPAIINKYNCQQWIDSANACRTNWDSSSKSNYNEAKKMHEVINEIFKKIESLNNNVAPSALIRKYIKLIDEHKVVARNLKEHLEKESFLPIGFDVDKLYKMIVYYAEERNKVPPEYDDEQKDIIGSAYEEIKKIHDYCTDEFKVSKTKHEQELADKRKTEYKEFLQTIKNHIIQYEDRIILLDQIIDANTINKLNNSNIINSQDDANILISDIEKEVEELKRLQADIENYGGSKELFIINHYKNSVIKELVPYFEEAQNTVIPKCKSLVVLLFENFANNPNVPKTKPDDDSLITNHGVLVKTDDEDTYVHFSLVDENYSELFFEDPDSSSSSIDFHDYSTYHELVDAAVNVKRQPIFSDYGDIDSYPCFKPFKYQLDSVRTMLTRFEGRGIFGDQVGLGKTIQALMTADVMSRCGAIKNAVIVANEHIIGQWRAECKNKFRLKDDSFIFDLNPSSESYPNISYSFEELLEKLKKDSEGNESSEAASGLKVYFLSTEKLKEESSINKLKDAKEALELEAELYKDERFIAPLDKTFVALTADLEKERCLARLFKIADKLIKEYNRAWPEDIRMITRGVVENYEGVVMGGSLVNGRYNWDVSIPWEIQERNKKPEENLEAFKDQNGYFFSDIIRYNAQLEKIRQRCIELEKRLQEISKSAEFYKQQRLIDLLIFDEVQDLLVSFSKKDKMSQEGRAQLTLEEQKEIIEKADNNRLIQEFIATIQKKYCILISATPIRDDIDDIFNLLYMVDKTRLGDTMEEAKKRFYDGYCDGYWSLSDMANAPDPKKAFANLNGLINSRFTRKRLYDSDVLECMCRQCATEEEIEEAKKLGRDDFGGAKFRALVEVCSCAYKLLHQQSNTDEETLIQAILAKKDFLFEDYFAKDEYEKELPDNEYIFIVKEISRKIDSLKNIAINKENVDLKEYVNCKDVEINICQRFLDAYESLVEYESLDDCDKIKVLNKSLNKQDAIKYALDKCNMYCSLINKGLLDLFNSNLLCFETNRYLRYPYLSDFIDRRRPPKKGISVICDSVDTKLDFVSTAFTITKDETLPDVKRKFYLSETTLTNEDIVKSLQQNKILLFEKDHHIRRDIYRRLRNPENFDPNVKPFGDKRRVYVNLPTNQEELDNIGYSSEEYLDFCYFDANGKNSKECKEIYDKISEKYDNEEELTLEETLYFTRYRPDRKTGIPTLDSPYANKSLDWFKSLDDVGDKASENWNSVYLMNQSQIAGTNMEAANVLVISQLDFYKDGSLRYMDPLELEQLVGRISRTGQTEECIVYTCLYNGLKSNEFVGFNDSIVTSETYDEQFNELYYNILADEKGFDLFGKCNTEVDFVVPVVMACLRQLYTNSQSAFLIREDYQNSSREFITVYDNEKRKNDAVELIKNIETFPQMLQFAKRWDDNGYVTIHQRVKGVLKKRNATEVVQEMVQTYAGILSHNYDASKDEINNSDDTNNN